MFRILIRSSWQVHFIKPILMFACIYLSQSNFANTADVRCESEGRTISAINYAGLDTTRRRVVDRQINIQVGAVLHCVELDMARQAIQDLGLFKSVTAETKNTESGVNVIFTVVEKRYLIMIPYVASSESGSLNYGLRGNWSNIGGLNQRASLKLRKKTFSTDLKDSEDKASISFSSPQIRDTDFDARIELSYIDLSTRAVGAPVNSEPFNEISRVTSFGLSRWFHQEQRQHGWNFGSALSWRAWESRNPILTGSIDAQQSHLGIEFDALYNKIHDRNYSFDGYSFTYRFEPSIALTGDRNPFTHEFNLRWHKPYGAREHTEFEIRGGFGISNGAYEDFIPFQNSLNAQLRGISYDDFEGDRYYYAKAAYLTPFTFKPFNRTRLSAYPSLRAELFAEVNDIYFSDDRRGLQSLAWSVGTGVRWRIPWFVGLQVGAGVAYHSEEKSVGFYITGR